MSEANTDKATATEEVKDISTANTENAESPSANTAAPETPAAGSTSTPATPAAPLDPSKMTPDELVENYSVAQLREYALTGVMPDANGTASEQKATAAAENVETKTDKEAEKTDKTDTSDASDADDAFVNEFKFTVDADAETLAKEEAAYLEKVDIPAPIQAMLDRRDAQITKLTTDAAETSTSEGSLLEPAQTEAAKKHMDAFDKLVSFKQTTRGIVPDTSGVIDLLKEVYPVERKQLVADLVSEPSDKFPGLTIFQEYIREYANLDDQGMQMLDTFLSNGGKMPTPSFTPEGINDGFAEAFWQSADRLAIQERLEASFGILRDEYSSDAEKALAKSDIQQINTTLGQIQRGLDADKTRIEAESQQMQQKQQEVYNAGFSAYTETALAMQKNMTGEIAKNLSSVFDETGANVVAEGFATLINNALSDQDEFAKAAQAGLAAQGVKFNWKSGKDVVDRLFALEMDIAALKHQNANKRAIEIKLNEKAVLLKESKGLEKELIGKIVEKVVSGSGKALAKQIAAAPKLKAVRPKANAATAGDGPANSYDNMTIEQLRTLKRQGEREMVERGIRV